jgi:TonB family protein
MNELPMKAKSILGICLAASAIGHAAFLALTTLATPIAPSADATIRHQDAWVSIAPIVVATPTPADPAVPVRLTATFATPTVADLHAPAVPPSAPLARAQPAPSAQPARSAQPAPSALPAPSAQPAPSALPAAQAIATAAPTRTSPSAAAEPALAAQPAAALPSPSSGSANGAVAAAGQALGTTPGTVLAAAEPGEDAAELAPASTVSLSGQEAARYLARVRSALGTPPVPDGADGASGVVEVLVVLDDRGRVLEVHVAHSSGHAVLDASAIAWLDHRRLPRPPRGIGAEAVAITVPVAYLAAL